MFNSMFWWAAGGLVLAMLLLFWAVLLIQLSARVTYIPGSGGEYAVSGVTNQDFTFSGTADVRDCHDHKGAEWAIRAWTFRRGGKVNTIVHLPTKKTIYRRK